MANRLKLTDEVKTHITEDIKSGLYFETACLRAGITKQTGFNWLKRGERESKGIFREFYEAVERANAEAELTALLNIKTGIKNWQAHAWFLERRFPDRWALKQKHEVGGKDGGPIRHEIIVHSNTAKKLVSSILEGEGT